MELPNHIADIQHLLICPASRAQGKGELPVAWNENGYFECGGNRYPLVEDIPNFRLPFDQENFTSYDDILCDFFQGKPDINHLMKINSMQKKMFNDATVLLGGSGAGTDIDWLLSLNIKKLICLDYSTFICTLRKKCNDTRVSFMMGDVCDLPFASCSIDMVISNGIIQQTRSPELAFGEKVRVLKKGGSLSIGNLYSTNLHNQRITMFRHKYLIHEMPRDRAKRFLVRNTKIYTWLQKTGLWRLHRRWPIPGILQYCNLPGHDFPFYLANAEDYYMARYRHITSSTEVQYWANRLGVGFAETDKGYLITK